MLSPRRFSPVVLCVFSLLCATSVFGRSADRAQLLSEIAALRDQLRTTSDPAQVLNLQHQIQIKELQFLSPAPEDQEAHAAFLRQPEAGLIRLLPRGKFDGVLLVRGGGAYYSFPRRTHAYDYGSDIELQSGEFSVGFAGADFGFLVRLGETPLAAVTLDLPAVQYLAAFQAPTTEPEAREQQRRSGAGFEANGFFYRDELASEPNITYAVRSVGYEASDGRGVPAAVALRVRGGEPSYEPVARFDDAQAKYVAAPIDLGAEGEQVFLILFGTGIRFRRDLGEVRATIDGVEAPVTFAGPQGGAGLDQVNLLLPRALAGRGAVGIALEVGGRRANPVTVNIR